MPESSVNGNVVSDLVLKGLKLAWENRDATEGCTSCELAVFQAAVTSQGRLVIGGLHKRAQL